MNVGRPTKYTIELATAICADLSEGKSLKRVCEAEEMPSVRSVWEWLRLYPEFSQMYARSKEESADALSDDLENIAQDVLQGKLDPNAGRVAADIKKWVAAKLKPRKYGDKIDMTTNGKDLPSPIYGGLSQSPKDMPTKT